jgi:hypothetical protein
MKQSLEQYCPTWTNEIAGLERLLEVRQSERETFLLKERHQFPSGIRSAAEGVLRELLEGVAVQSGGTVK